MSVDNDADLDAQALSWMAQTANVRTHRTTGEVPRIRFDRDERVLLKPLAVRRYRSLVITAAKAPRATQPLYPASLRVERRSLAWYDRVAGVTR
jgi:hypothetical protein